MKGSITNVGYRIISIRYECNVIHYSYHRFIYESHHGLIPDGYVVDHTDDNKLNNNIENLQIITQSQNLKKNYIKKSRVARPVRAICLNTGLINDFRSQKFAGKVLDVNMSSIKRVCENIQNTATSKTTGYQYYFHYLVLQQ